MVKFIFVFQMDRGSINIGSKEPFDLVEHKEFSAFIWKNKAIYIALENEYLKDSTS